MCSARRATCVAWIALWAATLGSGCAQDVELGDQTFAVEDSEEQVPAEEEAPGDDSTFGPAQCKLLPDGSLCASFDVQGHHVGAVKLRRQKRTAICDYQPFFEVFDQAGRRIARKVGPLHPACHPGALLQMTLQIQESYPAGARVCAGLREGFTPVPLASINSICVPLVP
jgi:hypothetical protein